MITKAVLVRLTHRSTFIEMGGLSRHAADLLTLPGQSSIQSGYAFHALSPCGLNALQRVVVR
ncbi:hypothetical protein GIY62_14420 [Burkholderia plantarii]|nr:hypothetical protein GIY62_14420 [Burkholderia plantarii]